MKLKVKIQKLGGLEEVKALRESYLAQLIEVQELFLERMVAQADFYGIYLDDSSELTAYCAVFNDTVLEFHVTYEYSFEAEYIFQRILNELKLKKAIVKSYDHLFFAACAHLQKEMKVKGLLVRDHIIRDLPNLGIEFIERLAEKSDLDAIMAIEQDVFTRKEIIAKLISLKQIVLYFDNDKLLGFGIIQPIFEGQNFVDLGIAVDKPYRRKGYAIYIMQNMMRYCDAHSLKPVAGCAAENIMSRRLGERAGLISHYRLLEFSF